jgi:hypothetical protein
MTFKRLTDEVNDLSVNDYKELYEFLNKLKKRYDKKQSDNLSEGLEDWSITKENWHEIELA